MAQKSDEQEDLLNRIQRLTGKVSEDRLMTQDLIHQAQEKSKLRHDDQIMEVHFEIGDLVLLY